MAWQKIPKENHPPFYAALPDDRRAKTIKMFGGVAGTVNGNMFGGLWADTVVVRLGERDREKVLAMKGGTVFDPMSRGRPMRDMVLLPKGLLKKKADLRRWLQRAINYTATLPPKIKKKKASKKTATAVKRPAKKAAAKRVAKKRPAKKKAAKKRPAKKKAAKKRPAKKKAAKKRPAKKRATRRSAKKR